MPFFDKENGVATHQDLILDQFTKQVVPFATAPGIKDEEALKLVVDFTGVGPNDTVLEVGGPGWYSCRTNERLQTESCRRSGKRKSDYPT